MAALMGKGLQWRKQNEKSPQGQSQTGCAKGRRDAYGFWPVQRIDRTNSDRETGAQIQERAGDSRGKRRIKGQASRPGDLHRACAVPAECYLAGTGDMGREGKNTVVPKRTGAD